MLQTPLRQLHQRLGATLGDRFGYSRELSGEHNPLEARLKGFISFNELH